MRRLQQFIAIPLLLVFALADRDVVLADAGRWAAIDETGGRCFDSPPAALSELLHMLGKYPEYRSLFYFRAAMHGVLGKVTARIAGVIWRGAPGLLIGGGTIGPAVHRARVRHDPRREKHRP